MDNFQVGPARDYVRTVGMQADSEVGQLFASNGAHKPPHSVLRGVSPTRPCGDDYEQDGALCRPN